jgi:A/G-specific adenine glycosylase
MVSVASKALEQFDFASALLAWHRLHGRSGLPWQGSRDPYRVWLSEIMLQQTQVVTVQAYYARFLDQFPDVAALAAASQDEVLALWSGLGYYSRARNLHACAQQVVAQWGGKFPRSAKDLQSLPGIGPSTAAAIASFCWGERVAILDGNVKRVLTRVLGFSGDLSLRSNEQALLQRATDLLPQIDAPRRMPRYTQAIMDLGATLCMPKQAQCERCPMQTHCVAHAQQRVASYPVKTKKLRRSSESYWLLWAECADGSVMMSKRPSPGVWAGLYCLPLFGSLEALEQAVGPAQRQRLLALEPFVHVLTHKDLHLHVLRLSVSAQSQFPELGSWHADWAALGLPAPIRKLLAS